MKVELIRTNGTSEQHEIKAHGASKRLEACHRIAGCKTFDTVNLKDGRIMMVDDDGWETNTVDHGNGHIEIVPIAPKNGKTINPEATKIYHSICRPGTTHQIVGDVVIALDEDFA